MATKSPKRNVACLPVARRATASFTRPGAPRHDGREHEDGCSTRLARIASVRQRGLSMPVSDPASWAGTLFLGDGWAVYASIVGMTTPPTFRSASSTVAGAQEPPKYRRANRGRRSASSKERTSSLTLPMYCSSREATRWLGFRRPAFVRPRKKRTAKAQNWVTRRTHVAITGYAPFCALRTSRRCSRCPPRSRDGLFVGHQ